VFLVVQFGALQSAMIWSSKFLQAKFGDRDVDLSRYGVFFSVFSVFLSFKYYLFNERMSL
jgi:hypothetical protein